MSVGSQQDLVKTETAATILNAVHKPAAKDAVVSPALLASSFRHAGHHSINEHSRGDP